MLSESTRQEFKEKFANLAANPDIWLLKARTLFMSASLVAEEVKRRWDNRDPRRPAEQTFTIPDEVEPGYLQAVYMLLVGFVLENLLKAHLIEKYRAYYRDFMTRSG